MAERAQVRSIDDIDRFRAHLVTFLSGARAAIDESTADVARQQEWLDLDRRKHWEAEVWRRQRKLEDARQKAFTEGISSKSGASSFVQMQVHRAEQSLDEAKSKLQKVKAWGRNFENQSLPMVKQIEQLHTVLTIEMNHALNFLNQSITSLDAYASRANNLVNPATLSPPAESDLAAPEVSQTNPPIP